VEALTLPFVQKFLWDGLQNTLQITAVSGVLALPLGVVFALLRLSRRPAIRWNATSYIEIAIQVYIVISLVSFVINLPGDVDGDRSWRLFAALSTKLSLSAAQHLRHQEGQFQGLLGVQPRVARRLVAAGQVQVGDLLRAP